MNLANLFLQVDKSTHSLIVGVQFDQDGQNLGTTILLPSLKALPINILGQYSQQK
jgi:hypothetical protein